MQSNISSYSHPLLPIPLLFFPFLIYGRFSSSFRDGKGLRILLTFSFPPNRFLPYIYLLYRDFQENVMDEGRHALTDGCHMITQFLVCLIEISHPPHSFPHIFRGASRKNMIGQVSPPPPPCQVLFSPLAASRYFHFPPSHSLFAPPSTQILTPPAFLLPPQ